MLAYVLVGEGSFGQSHFGGVGCLLAESCVVQEVAEVEVLTRWTVGLLFPGVRVI